jgi:hypothetical protein
MLTIRDTAKRNNINSNHRDLKIIFCAEPVPKSFSTNVAAPIDTANINIYKPDVVVEKSLLMIFFNWFI